MAGHQRKIPEKSPSGYRIGRERFAKISAVEGIELSPAAKKRADDSMRRGLSADERRKDIIRRHSDK